MNFWRGFISVVDSYMAGQVFGVLLGSAIFIMGAWLLVVYAVSVSIEKGG